MGKPNDEYQIQLTPEEHARQTRSWQAGDEALVKLSVAMRKAKEAKTNRELARARVAIQEILIRGMIADGASWGMVLEHLEKAMPDISAGDLFKALEALRKRILRERQKMGVGGVNESSVVAWKVPKTIDPGINKADRKEFEPQTSAIEGGVLTDDSDRQPGETDADYQLRKSLEPDPKGRQRFIGEH